ARPLRVHRPGIPEELRRIRLPSVAALPSRAMVAGVVEVEGDEGEVETRNPEAPFPLVAGQDEMLAKGRRFDRHRQLEEFAERRRLDIVDRMLRRLRSARRDLAVVVAEDGQ